MADGSLSKANATTWTYADARKFNATVASLPMIKHANATTWYNNFPREGNVAKTFNVVWTQGYNSAGVKLDANVWGDHPRCGDTANFQGLFGFDTTAMKAFVSSYKVQAIKFTCMFDDPAHGGNPVVNFAPHIYTSKPTSYLGTKANKTYRAQSVFTQTGSDYTRTIELPVEAWLNGTMGGILIYADPVATNSCRFAGKTTSQNLNAYNSTLEITILK